jgi:hypothetical protein
MVFGENQMTQTLSQAIREHALEAAQAGDWQAVADTLQAVSITAEPRKCGSKESSLAVAGAGGDPSQLLELLRADATGNLLYTRLADGSSEGGVIWAEPLLTVPYLQSRVADFSQPVINALVSLSAPVSHPWAEVTAEECAAAYLVGADVLLSINRTGGTLRVSMNVMRDGRQVRLAMLTEGQGSEADQALTTAIESAIDTWLAAGV